MFELEQSPVYLETMATRREVVEMARNEIEICLGETLNFKAKFVLNPAGSKGLFIFE